MKLNQVFAECVFLSCVLTAPAQTINEDNKFVASDAEIINLFGNSIGISGTTAIVGTWDSSGTQAGAAYLFDTKSGNQIAKLGASFPAPGDMFGWSVAISGTTAIVGARGHAGSAYVFDAVTGEQLFKLTESDSMVDNYFGDTVAISNSTAIVGAYRANLAGAAFLFNTDTGAQIFKLTSNDLAFDDQFGRSVGISGTTAIVGAPQDSDAGTHSGSAYLFDTTTGLQLAKLTASDAEALDDFGRSVAISGTIAIVGSPSDDDAGFKSGAAYLFDTLTGVQLAKLTASDAAADDRFGRAVAISGTTAIVGSAGDDDSGSYSGSAYLFDTTTGLQLAKLTASDAEEFDSFSDSVAISGTSVVVGAPRDDNTGSSSGSAYLFTLASPCLADLTDEGDLNFLDVSAFLSAFGNQDPVADFEADGNFNFLDVSAFLSAFGAGCP